MPHILRLLRLTALPIALVGGAMVTVPAQAQLNDDRALRTQVRDLKAEIDSLRQQLRSLRASLRTSGGARKLSVAQNEIPPTVAARFEVRMSQLELALRKLTGRVEDLAFNIRRTQKDAKKAENDFEYRLSQLEKGKPAARARTRARVDPTPPRRSTASRPADPKNKTFGRRDDRGGGSNDRGDTNILPAGPPAAQYRHAFKLMRRRETGQAITAFREFVRKHPRSRLAGNAYHWLGRTLFDQERFKDAARAFAAGYQKFPRHARAAENLLYLGVSLARIGQQDLACKSFRELRDRYPTSAPDIRRRARKERSKIGCR